MTDKKLTLRALAFALACLMLFPCLPVVANADSAPQTVTTTLDLAEDKLFVFDLSKGSVTIGSTFSGQGYVKNGNTWSIGTLEGAHDAGNKYYIFQSGTKTVNLEGRTLTLTATDIDNSLMINKTVVHDPVNNTGVVQTWAAAATGRTSTANYIRIGGGSSAVQGTFDVTIDDIWSTARTNTDNFGAGASGISVYSANAGNFKVTLRLKGDNRLEHLFYCNSKTNSSLTITNGAGTLDPIGSLTVIAEQDVTKKSQSSSYYMNPLDPNSTDSNNARLTLNSWDSVIGGYDGHADVYNLNLAGGVIYAGASEQENCTAIGAGGNGTGVIKIAGDAIVTAVTHSTGNAIGGGIAHIATGGAGVVTIGENADDTCRVYAYNFGIFGLNRVPRNSNGYGTSNKTELDMARHVPGTAIGGAGSIKVAGSSGTVTINGGTVVAQSLGGTAIGGGSTVGIGQNGAGGAATVTINGGNVRAESIGMTLTSVMKNKDVAKGTSHTVEPGTAIGGGSSIAKIGGEATVNINGGNIYATGIGGGGSTYDVGGNADVTIIGGQMVSTTGIGGGTSVKASGGTATVVMNGGTVVSGGIGGGFSQTYGYANGTVKIDGGSLNSTMAAAPVNTAGEPVQLTRVSLFYEDFSVDKDKITKLTLQKMGEGYTIKDVYTDENGMIYLWIPEDDGVTLATVASKGNLINFTPNDEPDRIINANDIGALIYDSTMPRYIVTIAGSSYYSLFQDAAKIAPFYGSMIVEGGAFVYYLTKEQECNLSPYIGVISPGGDKIIQPNNQLLTPVAGNPNLYVGSAYVQSNVTIWYEIEVGGEKFFAIDLSAGDVTITEQAGGGLTITQAGYTLSGYKGKIYLTSAGYPTSNTVTVHSEAGDSSNISIHADELTVVSNGPVLSIESGCVDLTFGSEDNLMHSVDGAPIYVGDGGTHGAKLNLAVDGTDSIKLNTSATDSPIIMGPGTLDLNNGGGFLNIGKVGDATSQIAVGEFNLASKNDKYTAELYRGKYSYTVVGYVQDSKLYPPGTNTNGQSFSARGIHEIYTGVESTIEFDEVNYKLIVTLTVKNPAMNIGYCKVTPPGDDSDEITDLVLKSKTDKTIVLEIGGDAFEKGNLTIMAATAGDIPHVIHGSVNDGKYVYDGQAHSITAMVNTSLFEVWYSSTEELKEENYDLAGSTTEPGYTDVGVYTVYYYIQEKGNADPEREYNAVVGSAQLEIVKGTNEWILDLECSDVICGKDPNPRATAKWNNVGIVYTYYIDNGELGKVDGADQKIDDPLVFFKNVSEQSDYYVIATVPAGEIAGTGDVNYDALISNPVYFQALKLDAYSGKGRQLDRVQDGNTEALPVANNDAFSAYYKTQSAGVGSRLDFFGLDENNQPVQRTLPDQTRITMIVFSGATAEYYYYVVDGNGISKISLTEFRPMGETGNANYYQPESGTATEYQFCFEYRDMSSGSLDVRLNESQTVRVACQLTWDEQLLAIQQKIERLEVAGGYESISITVNPNVNGMGYKYLAFRIQGTYEAPGQTPVAFNLVNVESALAISALANNDTTTDSLSPVVATNDILVFCLGGVNEPVNKQYTLILSNVPAGKYDLEVIADVRLRAGMANDSHILQGIIKAGDDTFLNRATRRYTLVDENNDQRISVSTRTDVRVVPKTAEGQLVTATTTALNFVVLSENEASITMIGVRLYQKNANGGYNLMRDIGRDGLVIINGIVNNEFSIDISALGDSIANGTYRIEFIYEGRSCFCNIVVAK